MDRLFQRHDDYLKVTPVGYVRDFINSVDWDSRLVCIKGPKGVGKSTMLRQRIKLNYPAGDRHVLYCSADTGYFTNHTLVDTAEMFVKIGGTHLFIDEIHKYDKWSVEIKEIYDLYPQLHIVLSGSSLLGINSGRADLSRRMLEYDMPGLSFREYLMFEKGLNIKPVGLEDLLDNPSEFCSMVTSQCAPLEFFPNYLRSGYYPFYFEESAAFAPKVEGVINYIIDNELPEKCGVEVSNTRKIKALLQVISGMVPYDVDIAKISKSIGLQRATLLQYLRYLEDAKLVRRLFTDLNTTTDLQKPEKLLLDNSNVLYALCPSIPEIGTVRESYFCNQLSSSGHRVEYGGVKNADFRIDGKYLIEVGGKDKDYSQIPDTDNGYIAADNVDNAIFHKIPLWAFGFLY